MITGRSVRLNAGLVELTPDQEKTRSANLRPVGGDVFEIIKPIEFKSGELIGYEGTISKAMANELLADTPEEPLSEKIEKKAKAKNA